MVFNGCLLGTRSLNPKKKKEKKFKLQREDPLVPAFDIGITYIPVPGSLTEEHKVWHPAMLTRENKRRKLGKNIKKNYSTYINKKKKKKLV